MLRSLALLAALALPAAAQALTCGNDASGFEAWKGEFAQVAAANGVGPAGLNALAGTTYASRTIAADRDIGHAFRGTVDEFMQRRGGATIISQGKRMLERDRPFYDSLEAAYGVPAGILIAIHGMETGFGHFMGDANVLDAIVTLAYDCRRPDFFQPHALAALMLVDRGSISPASQGALHGELGHTQFLPGNILQYGQDGNGDGRVDLTDMADAMASTANFLRGHGWQPGLGYGPGEPNFAVLGQWNAASVYQQALAVMGPQIEPGR